MRPAPSFLLSLLMFAAILSVQIAALWPAGMHDKGAILTTAQLQPREHAADMLQEFEEDVDDDAVELSMYRPHRPAEVNAAQEDRNELCGPPEGIAVGVAPVWVPPQAHVTHSTFPWPEGMLRPPKLGLPRAGRIQRA